MDLGLWKTAEDKTGRDIKTLVNKESTHERRKEFHSARTIQLSAQQSWEGNKIFTHWCFQIVDQCSGRKTSCYQESGWNAPQCQSFVHFHFIIRIDDIEDGSLLRRGLPVAHKIYGIPLTINCANYVYFLVMKEVNENFPNSIAAFTEEMINLHFGQGLEIYHRDNNICPSFQDYYRIVENSGIFFLS